MASRKRIQGESQSTDDLFKELFEQLRRVRKEMERRRSREKASTALTDAFVCFEKIGQRLNQVSSSFDERPARRDLEEEEYQEYKAEQRPMADLFPAEIHNDEEELDDHMRKEMREDVLNFQEVYVSIRQVRLRHYRDFLGYLLEGCVQLSDVTHKLLALCRRVRPDLMEAFGISQVAVSRKLGQKRATVSAREIKKVEKSLKAAGVKGYHLLGGTKTESQRANCAKAQMGNTNRRDGEMKKRAV